MMEFRIMADSNVNTEIPAIPEPHTTSVKLYELAADMMAGELRDALMAARTSFTPAPTCAAPCSTSSSTPTLAS
jgi:hypothetical protein